MKTKVLIGVSVVLDEPLYLNRWITDVEQRAKNLQAWANEIEKFIRDHRSQDPVSINIVREYQDQCSFCKREFEVDADGPTCCDAAMAEWNSSKEKTA